MQCTTPGFQAVMYAKDFSFSEKIPEWLDDIKAKLPDFLTPGGPYDLMGSLPEPVRPIVWMG